MSKGFKVTDTKNPYLYVEMISEGMLESEGQGSQQNLEDMIYFLMCAREHVRRSIMEAVKRHLDIKDKGIDPESEVGVIDLSEEIEDLL